MALAMPGPDLLMINLVNHRGMLQNEGPSKP